MKAKYTFILLACMAAATSLSAHSRAIKPEFVDMLLTEYFSVQKALADDNLGDAKKSAGMFKSMLGHGPSFDDAPSLLDLQDHSEGIAAAGDIKTARNHFLTLSEDLAEMVEHVGTSGSQDVFQMNCPMAFEGKGGDWLQNSKDLTNPYYGSMMFKCGSVKSQLAKNKGGDSSGHSHSGHKEQDHSKHQH
ncbi:MAG: DUF3347 domain-containing protein [Verrucomicrobiae bacterium]|nr:DUF3347 domain-containing protein [Verrucomicrobiae bacterium]